MGYSEFYEAAQHLKDFINEQEKLKTIVEILAPSNVVYVEFGNKFIDQYIKLVEHCIQDHSHFYSWFVFENDFGKNHLELQLSGQKHQISNEKEFYDFCCQYYKIVS